MTSWMLMGSVVLNTILAVLFIGGLYSMTRRYLKRMNKDSMKKDS